MIVPPTNFCAAGRILFGNFSSILVCGKPVLVLPTITNTGFPQTNILEKLPNKILPAAQKLVGGTIIKTKRL
jgi:hypothetical protein